MESDAPDLTAGRRDPPAHQPVVALRCLAALIDVVLLACVFVLLAAAQGGVDTGSGVQIHLTGVPAVIWFVGALAYYFLTESEWGRTIGKAVCGLRVVRAQDGGQPSVGAIAGRTLLRVVDALPVLYALGLLVVLVNPSRQRIGDLAARTLVVAG